MEYEYTLWTMPVPAAWLDGTPDSFAQDLARVSNRLLHPLPDSLRLDLGGAWEPISHDVLRLEDGAILSILVRRPSSPSPDSPDGSQSTSC